MLRILRELESNIFAMMLAVFAFLLLLFIVAVLADVLFHVVDWSAVLGLGGMGTGNAVNSGISQALSNRSPNYTPLVANKDVAPLPTKRDPGDLT